MTRPAHAVPPMVALATIVLAVPRGATAQELNYHTFVVGERALGMGGAFTAVADDPSAAYYNPAGIAHLRSGALSGSLSVNAFDRYVVRGAYATPLGSDDLTHDASPTVPLFVGIVRKFGRRDGEGVRRWAVALSTFNPIATVRAYEALVRGSVPGDPTGAVVESILRMRSEERLTWYGPSLAWRARPDLAFGASTFLATRTASHEERETIVTLGARGPDGYFRNDTLDVRDSLVELRATSVLLRAGLMWEPARSWRLGLTVQPPAIAWSAEGRVSERISHADLLATPPIAIHYRSDQRGLRARAPIPWQLRLGGAFAPSDVTIVALDLALHGPVGSRDEPVERLASAAPEPETMRAPSPGRLFASTWWAEPVLDAAVGLDTVLFEWVPLRLGVFTNRSAAPDLDGPSNTYRPAHVDQIGFSGAVGLRAAGYDVAVGAAVLVGRGKADGLNGDPSIPWTYVPRPVETRTVYFFLSGAQRAVGRLARAAYREAFEP